jgi:hypothetical protein
MSVDPTQLMQMLGGGGDPTTADPAGGDPSMGGGDPSQMMGPPPGAGGDPNVPGPGPGGAPSTQMEQAVWSQFPSTDPNVIGRLVGPALQGGPTGVAQILQALPQMWEHDQDLLAQMQRAQLQSIVQQLMAPPPDAAMGPQTQPPEVGGDTTGY